MNRPDSPEQAREKRQKILVFQRERAEAGSPLFQYELGMRYLQGDGVPRDAALARQWFAKSAAQGEPRAMRKAEELGLSAATAPSKP